MGRQAKRTLMLDSRRIDELIVTIDISTPTNVANKPMKKTLKPPALMLFIIRTIRKTDEGISSKEIKGIQSPVNTASNIRLLIIIL